MPRIYLPLDEIIKCQVCNKQKKIRLCSQCAEASYCSPQCQKEDWPTHKKICKTDRIDLTSFHPVLALIAEAIREKYTGKHPALQHQVINSPNPSTPAHRLPNGIVSKVVRLGDQIPPQDFAGWWPTAQSPKVCHKMLRRINREGNVLPICFGICLALLHTIYSTTTTADGHDGHRIRLRYRSSPIVDFGIAKGKMKVVPEDRLAYVFKDGSIRMGQDPENHYWIYFRTQKGEEVLLDCSMFTFNMCMVVDAAHYVPGSVGFLSPYLPVYFQDRTITKGLDALDSAKGLRRPELHTERARFSVLRDVNIIQAFEDVSRETGVPDSVGEMLEHFLSTMAGREATEDEKTCLFDTWTVGFRIIWESGLKDNRWKHFPATPTLNAEIDPGEIID